MKSHLFLFATLLLAGGLFAGSVNLASVGSKNTNSAQTTLTQTPSGSGNGLMSTKPSTSQTTTPSTSVSTASSNTSDTSANWAGYEASGSDYTSITGTWTVPSVSVSGTTSADATWVGIGGTTTEDLIQVGTQDVVGSNGQVSSAAFYELLPQDSQNITDVNVSAGDSITASLKETSTNEWTITIKDNTNGSSYTTNVEYNSSENSAEWIEEDPSSTESQIPLDDFGSVTFTGATTTEDGNTEDLSTSSAKALTMVDDEDQELATTSLTTSNGKGFIVTRSDAESAQNVDEYEGYIGGFSRHGIGIGESYGFGSSLSQSYDGLGIYSEIYSY